MAEENYYSLSGYLNLKTKGALRLMIPARKLWFVFNESTCELESYLDEKSFMKKDKNSLIHKINISRSVIITSYVDEINQFKIL
jgi:hypothetical protein